MCYLLANHQEWQTALRDEVLQNLASFNDDSPQLSNLSVIMEGLPVLNGVINETLRLFPTIPATTRIAAHDTTLGGQHIPKNMEVLISPWVINRSPGGWGETANTFDPGRWIDNGRPNKHGHAKNNYDFATFLTGPRSCIGEQFARNELRCLVSAMVRRFEWTLGMPDSEVVPGGVITIRPKNGLQLKLKRLQNNI